MKRYRFVVLVLLIITVSATGCRRRSGFFGLRGARCSPTAVVAPVQTPVVVTQSPVCCPTPVCPPAFDCCPPGEFYGGNIYGGQFIQGESYGGTVFDSTSPYSNLAPSDVAPSIPLVDPGFRPADDTGALNHGLQPAFQVIGDRKLEPGESLPPMDDTAIVSAKSDKTAQVPKK